jgi:hypothetical protein
MARFFCPSCRRLRTYKGKRTTCRSCGGDLLVVDEELTGLLKGRRVVAVAYEPYHSFLVSKYKEREGGNDVIGLEYDGHEIYLILSDGSMVKAWNSEWGGIEYLTKRSEEAEEAEEAELRRSLKLLGVPPDLLEELVRARSQASGQPAQEAT